MTLLVHTQHDAVHNSNLGKVQRPRVELVEMPGVRRRARLQSFREHVEKGQRMSESDHLLRNGLHEGLQQAEVVRIS